MELFNRTYLDSCDAVSEHEINWDQKRKAQSFQNKFRIKKPDYPLKHKEFTDGNGLRYYKTDKNSSIVVIKIEDF